MAYWERWGGGGGNLGKKFGNWVKLNLKNFFWGSCKKKEKRAMGGGGGGGGWNLRNNIENLVKLNLNKFCWDSREHEA